MSETVRVLTADTDAEVLANGEWCFAMIAEWRLDADGVWWAWARAAAPDGNRILTVPETKIREPQVDWSRDRSVE